MDPGNSIKVVIVLVTTLYSQFKKKGGHFYLKLSLMKLKSYFY